MQPPYSPYRQPPYQQLPHSILMHPKRSDTLLHAIKTLKLVGSLMADIRIPLWRKALFFSSIAGLLVLLLFPDILNEALLSVILPIVGTILGVPLGVGFDWVVFALAVVSLLQLFPAELVSEHYMHIFQ